MSTPLEDYVYPLCRQLSEAANNAAERSMRLAETTAPSTARACGECGEKLDARGSHRRQDGRLKGCPGQVNR